MKKLILILLVIMATFNFTDKHLELVAKHPATTLGPLVGYNKLTELHDKWIIDVWDRELPLQAHRGSYKTTAVTQIGSLRWHLFHPNDRIGIYRKPYNEAAKTVLTITKFYEIEAIQALFYFAHGIFPKFKQKREESVVFNFKKTNTNEGSLNAYSIDKPKTGSHLDKAICDDFVTLEDRVSPAARKKTDQGMMELNANIMDPGQVPGYVGTPWHPKDAWKLIPGEIQRYDTKATGLLTPEQIEVIKSKTTTSLYACNYDLKHIADEDAVFRDPLWDRWDFKVGPVIGHLDAKYSGTHTNGLTFMARRSDGFIQAIGFTGEKHIDEELSRFAELYRKYRVKRLHNEENADKGYLSKKMKTDEKMNVETYHENMKKHVKITSFLKPIWNRILWDPNTDPEYMEQILDWREGEEPDDCPDSASSLIREAFSEDKSYDALYKA